MVKKIKSKKITVKTLSPISVSTYTVPLPQQVITAIIFMYVQSFFTYISKYEFQLLFHTSVDLGFYGFLFINIRWRSYHLITEFPHSLFSTAEDPTIGCAILNLTRLLEWTLGCLQLC